MALQFGQLEESNAYGSISLIVFLVLERFDMIHSYLISIIKPRQSPPDGVLPPKLTTGPESMLTAYESCLHQQPMTRARVQARFFLICGCGVFEARLYIRTNVYTLKERNYDCVVTTRVIDYGFTESSS